MPQAAAQGGIAVERGELAEQLAGAGEQHGVTVDHRLMGDVAGEGGFADPVGADQDGVGCVLEEVERHQRLEGCAVAAFGPVPIEVAERLETSDMSGAQAALEASASAFLLLPVDQRRKPAGRGSFPPMRQQAMQVQRFGTDVQSFGVTHHRAP